ncbi:MAG: histidinol dehydrogenase [bacterium]|nr:histidinol dehydrogenase [bacterium]
MNLFDKVLKIIDDVKKNGDDAIRKYTKLFDRVYLKDFKVPLKATKPKKSFIDNVEKMINRVKGFHEKQIRNIKDFVYEDSEVRIIVKHIPIERVCIYVPGGRYFYPSTLIMTALPAICARVKEIYVTTPPKAINDRLIYIVNRLSLNGLYSIGGVQAIAGFAFGTKTVPKVDLIAGPGNEYVNIAKKLLFGEVGIDVLAGPSEAVVIVDNPKHVKKALLEVNAQLEHSPVSRGFVFTTNRNLLKQLGSYGRYFKSKEEVVNEINKIAPEHIFIMAKGYENFDFYAGCVVYNGSIVFTDYFAGSSHTLPTGGSARFMSGLSVYSFLRRTNYIRFKKFDNARKLSSYFAKLEGLKNHYKASTQIFK